MAEEEEVPTTEKAEFIPEEQADEEQNDDVVDGPQKTRRDRSNSCCVLFALLAILLIIAAFFAGYFVRRHMHGTKCRRTTEETKPQDKEKSYSKTLADVSPSNIESQLRYFSSIPHAPGSNESHQQALYMADKFKEYGFDSAELKKYSILLSFPAKPGHASLLDVNGKVLHASASNEKILDPAEDDPRVLSPFNAFSPSGNVKGKLVYVNYGHLDDFTKLDQYGVNVSGKVVIVRYGKIARGQKVVNAHEYGAKAVIIYSDPADYALEGMNKTYPDYEWLSEDGVQRGNIWMVKGDPLTPGYPATEGIYRVSNTSLPFPKIPTIPISWRDAKPLLKTLTKTPAPKEWRGGLDIDYNIEMDTSDTRDVKVEVFNKMEQKPVYNVIGTITGSKEPDRYIIIGNHRDAWIFGAVDPSSGTAAIMEAARLLGELRKTGWRPSRTIMFASWGAEEPGVMGSAEWVEEFEKKLIHRAVTYLNVDVAVAGTYSFRPRSIPIMDTALFEATKKVPSVNNKSETLFDLWRSRFPDKNNKEFPSVVAAKSGSDFFYFLQRLGVPCVDLSYRRKKGLYPVYHTLHDTFRWMKKFIDPDFRYHSTIVKTLLRLIYDIVDSEILPFDLNRMSSSLETYVKELETQNINTLSSNGISLSYITQAVDDLKKASEAYMNQLKKVDLNKPLEVRIANDKLIQVERAFINSEGLPGQPLMKNVIFSPSIFPHYTGSKFAGINDAIFMAKRSNQTKDWEQVKKQISMVVHALRSAATMLKQ